MIKIGWGQLAFALMISRVFSEATSIPETNIAFGMQRYSVIIISFLLTLIAYVPLIFIAKRFPDENFITVTMRKSRAFAAVFGIIFAAAIFMVMSETSLRIHYYGSSTIFDAAPSLIFYILITAACLYALYKGIQSAARMSVIAAAGFALLMILILAALTPEIKTDRLYLAFSDRPETFMREVITEFSLNSEALIFAVLCADTREKANRTVFLYIGLSCAALITMTFLYNTVFGELLSSLNFPFYTLASISDVAILQRLNGIDVIIWVMSAVIKLSLLAISIKKIILDVFGNRLAANITSASSVILSSAAAMLYTVKPEIYTAVAAFRSSGIPVVITIVLLPVIALAVGCSKKRRRRRYAE